MTLPPPLELFRKFIRFGSATRPLKLLYSPDTRIVSILGYDHVWYKICLRQCPKYKVCTMSWFCNVLIYFLQKEHGAPSPSTKGECEPRDRVQGTRCKRKRHWRVQRNEMKTKMLVCAKERASFLSQEGEVGKLGQATFPRQNNSYSHFQATCDL